MEIDLHVIKVIPQVSGTSAQTGKVWTRDAFIGETYDQFPRKVCITVFGIGSKSFQMPKEGDDVHVSFDIESRSFVGKDGIERWSTDLLAWKISPQQEGETIGPATQPQAPAPQPQYNTPYSQYVEPQQPISAPSPQPQPDSDLPF